MAVDRLSGPIPGENYTSDVRNYPWHRPPEYVNPDEAIEYLSRTFSREESIAAAVSMIEIGLTIATITDIIITKGISEGKWAVDLGLILAGPVAHMLIIIAKGYDLKFELGVKKKFKAPTAVFFKAMKKQMKNDKANKEIKNEIASTGFMAGIPSDMETPSEVETPGEDAEEPSDAEETEGMF